MSNMSYCRFENTSRDMIDCLNTLGDAIDTGLSFEEFFEDLSEDEQWAIKRLVTTCSEFIEYVNIMKAHTTGEDYV